MNKDNLNSLLADSGQSPSVGETSDLLTAAYDALPDALYFFNDEGVLSKANRAGIAVQGCAGEALTGKRCCEMFWRAEDAENCVVDRSRETGERVEVEILVGNDESKPTLVIVQPLDPGRNGSHSGTVVIARDISDLRRAEADALAQRSFMASIADRSPDEIYALDKDSRITWMNERGEADNFFMLSGRYFVEFVAEDSRAVANENLLRTFAGEDTHFATRAVRVDGTILDVEAHTSPLWKESEITGALVFLRDVTERKRTQELAAQSDKLRAVGELAAGVAHNLNNSLTVIQGRAQLLMMRTTDESVVKSLKIITSAVEEGTKTLRRILEFARREASSEFAPVDLADLLTSSIEIARPKWQSKSNPARIEVKIECNGPVYVMGELAELREVVLNLLFNAVDAMPEGGTMEVGTRGEIDSGCFWVADTGAGMSAETAARIFEPFYTTKGKKGTGLGLSASHGIISRHNGEILVVSEPGEGTRFEVRLPICDKISRFVKNPDATKTDQDVPEELTVAG
jgi:PAS domain S-box-containing protein